MVPPLPKPKTIKHVSPVPTPRTNITLKDIPLGEFTTSFKISIRSDNNALKQLKETRKAIFHMSRGQLLEMKDFKFVETLKITFWKMMGGEDEFQSAFFNLYSKAVINEADLERDLKSSSS